MKDHTWHSVYIFLLLLAGAYGCRENPPLNEVQTESMENSFMGQELPGPDPELLCPGLISTRRNERDFTMSPDGKEVFFSYALPGFSLSTIVSITIHGSGCSTPETAWFSGSFSDLEPAFSPDGNKLFFISRRPLAENDSTGDWNIWVTERADGAWKQPTPLASPVNGEGNEYYPSVSANGNLYFTLENHPATYGGEDIYFAEFKNGHYEDPVNLGEGVNSSQPEFNAYVSPDEKFLVFSSWGRRDGIGGGDLYISFRNEEGIWQKARNLGKEVNSDKLDYCPFVSHDGTLLFFTSQRLAQGVTDTTRKDLDAIWKLEDRPGNGLGDIYWVAFDPEKWMDK